MKKLLLLVACSILKVEAAAAPKTSSPTMTKNKDSEASSPKDEWKSLKQQPKKQAKSTDSVWSDLSKQASDWASDILGWLKDINVSVNNINNDNANVKLSKHVITETNNNLDNVTSKDHPMAYRVKGDGKKSQEDHEKASASLDRMTQEIKDCVRGCREQANALEKKAAELRKTTSSKGEQFSADAKKMVEELNAALESL